MSSDLMNYEQMTQLALRGVVRDAVRRVIREDGLPGAHHFYITFLTRYPGVEIDEGLAAKYPEEITIVLNSIHRRKWKRRSPSRKLRLSKQKSQPHRSAHPPRNPSASLSQKTKRPKTIIQKKIQVKKSSAWTASGRSDRPSLDRRFHRDQPRIMRVARSDQSVAAEFFRAYGYNNSRVYLCVSLVY